MLLAVALVQDLFQPVAGDHWITETTYTFRSVEFPAESQLWKWRETNELKENGDLAVKRSLVENRLDGVALPLPLSSDLDAWVIKNPFSQPVRDPQLEDPTTYRLWRLTQVPRPGLTYKWQAGTRWPAAEAKCSFAIPRTHRATNGQPIAIQFSFSEPGGLRGKGEGFCAPDGILRAGSLTVENAFLPGGEGAPHRLDVKWVELKS